MKIDRLDVYYVEMPLIYPVADSLRGGLRDPQRSRPGD